MTVIQKDLETACTLSQENLKKRKTLSDEKLMLRKELPESGKLSQSMKDLTASEQFEEIHELTMTTIAVQRSLNEKETLLDKAMLRLNRCIAFSLFLTWTFLPTCTGVVPSSHSRIDMTLRLTVKVSPLPPQKQGIREPAKSTVQLSLYPIHT